MQIQILFALSMNKRNLIIIMVSLVLDMVLGLTLVFGLSSNAGDMGATSIFFGTYVIVNIVIAFFGVALYHKISSKIIRDGHLYKEQLDILTEDLKATKEELKLRTNDVDLLKKNVGELNNINTIYEKMIKSLRSVISNESSKLKDSYLLLEEARQKGLQSDKLKSAFLSTINHEIRTPINGILGFSSILGSPNLPPDRRARYSEILSNSMSRFLDTFNDIIYYSQIQAGDITPTISTFNVSFLIANIVNMANNYLAEQKRHLAINVKNNLSEKVMIRGFENGYLKILSNLMNNAVKFTKEGSVDIGYEIHDSKIKFVITDTGIGFSSATKDSLFESFTQGDNNLSRQYEGSGLGLSICKGLTNMMNGEIGAESHKNIGSKFWVELPLLSDEDSEIDIFNEIEQRIKNEPFTGKIIVITPDNDDFNIIKEFCNSYNVEVSKISSAAETVEYLRNESDILISIINIEYSVLESIHCAQQILDIRPDMKFAFLANCYITEIEHQKLSAFSEHIIEKPITSLELSKLLNF